MTQLKIENKEFAFALIDFGVLLSFLIWEGVLKVSNLLGIAWWAKVETYKPNVTYWFGPFLTRRALGENLDVFLSDLSAEDPAFVSKRFSQFHCKGPFTLENDSETRDSEDSNLKMSI